MKYKINYFFRNTSLSLGNLLVSEASKYKRPLFGITGNFEEVALYFSQNFKKIRATLRTFVLLVFLHFGYGFQKILSVFYAQMFPYRKQTSQRKVYFWQLMTD